MRNRSKLGNSAGVGQMQRQDSSGSMSDKDSTQPPASLSQKECQPFLDGLRILLVMAVVCHSCVSQLSPDSAYSFGTYYAGPPSSSVQLSTRLAYSFLVTLLQSHVWALLFLTAGYLTPASYSRKGPLQYLHDKSVRLLLPLAAWELLLRPACFYLAHASGFGLPAGLPQLKQQLPHGSTVVWLYRWYFGWYRAVGESHMWFVAMLFLMHVGYVGVDQLTQLLLRHVLKADDCDAAQQPFMTRNVRRQMRRTQQQLQLLQQQQSPFFSERRVALVLGALAAGLCLVMFLVLCVAQHNWSLHIVNVQYCYVFQHLLAFALGVQLQQHDVLAKLPPAFCYKCMVLGLGAFVVGWLPDVLSLETDAFPAWLDALSAWWNLLFAAYTQIFAVLWSVGLLIMLRQNCNHRRVAADGTWRQHLVQLSHWMYVLHPLALVVFSLACSSNQLHPLAFVAAACVVVNVCSCLLAAAVTKAVEAFQWPVFRAAARVLSGNWLQEHLKQLLQGAEHVL